MSSLLTSFPLPRCAICQRPVERLDRFQDFMADRQILVAHCHGDSERVEIGHEELLAMVNGHVGLGDAFASKLLPALAPQLPEARHGR